MDYKAEYQAQMTALADSIREKAGTSGKMTIDQMPSAVESIPTDGIVINGVEEVTAKALEAIVNGDTVKLNCASTEITPPSTKPTGTPRRLAWNPDGTRLAVAHDSSPYLTVYNTTTTPYTKLANPSSLPTGAKCCAWNPDGTRLACALNISSNTIAIYDTTTTPYTKLANPSTSPSYAEFCAWNPDGTRLAVRHSSSPYITMYDTTVTPYTKITNVPTFPSATVCFAWSKDGTRFAVGSNSLPCITIYDATNEPYTKIANPTTLPTAQVNGISWTPDGTRLAILQYNPYRLIIYDTTSTPYRAIAEDENTKIGWGTSCDISFDGKILATTHQFPPFLTFYDATNSYKRLPNISTYPIGAHLCAWNPDGTRLAVGNGTSTSHIQIFAWLNDIVASKASNENELTNDWLGCAKEAIASGSEGTVVKIFG